MASSLMRGLLAPHLRRRLPYNSLLAAPSPVHRSGGAGSVSHFAGTDQSFFRRYFSSDDGDAPEVKNSTAASATLSSTLPVADYDVEDIMRTFGDTSYYDPIERPDYSNMTNEELKDTSTIPGWELIHSPPKDKDSIPRGALVGRVVSTKMQKTVNVEVDRYKTHGKYGKRLRYTRKFMAHDDAQVASAGDWVMIVPCQRISKHKHFMLREIIRAKGQI